MFNVRKQELMQQLGQDTIFDALVALLREEGLDGLTMQKVARQAGMATGTLYKYFRSKEELLNYADQRLGEKLLEEATGYPADASAGEKLRHFTRASLDFCQRNTATFVILKQAQVMDLLDRERQNRQKSSFFGQVQAIMRQGVETGEFRPVDTATASSLFLSLLIGYFHVRIDCREIEVDCGTRMIHEMMTRYLSPNPHLGD